MSGNDTNNDFPPGEGVDPSGAGVGEPSLNTGKPAVASAPGKLIFVLILAAVFMFVIAKSLFFGKEPEVVQKEQAHHKEKVTAEAARSQNELSISPGSLPAPPTTIELTSTPVAPPPPPPPPPPALLTPPNPEVRINGGANDEQLNKRIHASLLSISGAKQPAAASKRSAAVLDSNDPNGVFAQTVSMSQAEVVQAGKVGDLNVTIAQGKLIHAVMESAINSQLPGPIRAIVSHDIYAEAGRDVLIPKGSRIIGTYNASIKRGQGRVFMIWHRVIRPDGIDIMIDSPGVDALGRAGLDGDVDNRYFEMFSTAIMTSAMDVGVAAAGQALFGDQQTTTTNNGNGSTTTESPTATAMRTAIENIGSVGSSIVNSALSLSPIISIDQGTPINIFVNRDLVFPRSSSTYIE